MNVVPKYLEDYAATWETDPHQANLDWFADARWGLFMHYGLYAQMAAGEWVQFRRPVPIAEYEKLYDTFDPQNFDADFITDLALEAEMKYVNITACHHEGFCLWKSDVEAWNSYNACRRDLVRELAEQCDKKGLGFFTYFTHILNWRHPYAMTTDILPMARPPYEHDEPRYELTDPAEFSKFWEWSHGCMKELLELEYPLAGMWLDIIMGYYQAPDLIPIEETYRIIREMRPEALISFKQGATGTEDFASPERSFHSMADRLRDQGNDRGAEIAASAFAGNRNKHNEVCMTLQENCWGYHQESRHFTAAEVRQRLAEAHVNNCNMLANVGPLPDGSIHPDDIACLRACGKRIREDGWPTPTEAAADTTHHPTADEPAAG